MYWIVPNCRQPSCQSERRLIPFWYDEAASSKRPSRCADSARRAVCSKFGESSAEPDPCSESVAGGLLFDSVTRLIAYLFTWVWFTSSGSFANSIACREAVAAASDLP